MEGSSSSAEPHVGQAMLSEALPGHDVAHQNFVKPYEGRAEAFIHPFPQSCSPNCPHQQESVPYSFPIFMDMEQSKQDFHAWMLGCSVRDVEDCFATI